MVTWFIGSRIRQSKWNTPDGENEFAYLDFHVLNFFFFKKQLYFNYLPPDPVQLVWEGSGNQQIK